MFKNTNNKWFSSVVSAALVSDANGRENLGFLT
jgi:hypothetical protein